MKAHGVKIGRFSTLLEQYVYSSSEGVKRLNREVISESSRLAIARSNNIMEPGKIIKTFTSKKGNRVIIRYPKWEDLDDLHRFINALSKEDTFVKYSGEEISREEEARWLGETLLKMETAEKVHLVATVNGSFAGNCEIRRHKRRETHVGTIGISVAPKYRDEGIGAALLSALIEQGKKAGLKLLILHCFETNDRALHLYEKLGFTRAGLVPGVYAYKGSFVGEVTLYLLLPPGR